MEQLIKFLLLFGQLNEEQIAFIKTQAEDLYLAKNDYFSEAGKISRRVGFVVQGAMTVSYYNNRGDEVVHHFVDENQFFVDLESFNSNMSSTVYVKAVTDCKLLIFTSSNWQNLSATIINWDAIVNKITTRTLLNKVNALRLVSGGDATARYQEFLVQFPGLANKVPLTSIASYLGITPTSLSRIRASLKK